MKNYKRVLRLLIKDIFKKREKKQVLIFVLLGVLYTSIALLIVSFVILIGGEAKAAGKSVELTTTILFADFAVTIFFGILAAMSFLFMSRDSEFFKTLPVKESQVFMAKLTIVYITEALLSAVLLIPALLTAGIRMDFPPLFFCLIPIFALVVPVFSLLFIALISLPFMYIVSKLKNRATTSSIILIFVFAVGFGLYMYFMLSVNPGLNGGGVADGGDGVEVGYESTFNVMTYFAKAFFPVYMLANFATKTQVFGLNTSASMAASFGIFLFSLAAFFALSMLLCTMVYRKATSRLLENTSKNRQNGKHASSSTQKALMKFEWRQIIRNPIVAMQVVSGIILCPLIVVIFSVMIGNMSTMFSDPELGISIDIAPVIWLMGILSVMMFGVGINTGAVTCISREGRCLSGLKSMPIDPKIIIKAKKATYLIISSISIVTGIIAMFGTMIYYDVFLWWIPLGGLPVALVWLYAMTNLSIYSDLKNPKLEWKNLREVLKRGKNNLFALIWILACMAFGTVLVVFAFIGIFTSSELFIGIGYALLFGLGLGAATIFRRLLDRNACNYFNRLYI